MESVDNHKNLEIELLQKDKEQLNSQLIAANKIIEEKTRTISLLEIELNEANQKLSSKSDAKIK
jgi:prefoldin subunit 5